MKPVIILSTYPDKESATKAARLFVGSRLCACVNMLEASSVYSWNGEIEDAQEYLAVFKTSMENRELLREQIQKMHPYDVPEIAEIDVASVNDSYLDWIIKSTGRPDRVPQKGDNPP